MTNDADKAIYTASEKEVERLANGFLKASAFADCSRDDDAGLESSEWSEDAISFAKDCTRIWLDNVSKEDYGKAISDIVPHPDTNNDGLQSLGTDIYYEMAGHGVGFEDRRELEQGGLAHRLAAAARTERIEPPYLGEDDKRHFLDEYRLYNTVSSKPDILKQTVRRALMSAGIKVPLTGPKSLDAAFAASYAEDVALIKKTPGFENIGTIARHLGIDADEAIAAASTSIAMLQMDVPYATQHLAIKAVEEKVSEGKLDRAVISLILMPPIELLEMAKPGLEYKAISRGVSKAFSGTEKDNMPEQKPEQSAPSPTMGM